MLLSLIPLSSPAALLHPSFSSKRNPPISDNSFFLGSRFSESMASSLISNPSQTTRLLESKRKKRKKNPIENKPHTTRWRTPDEHLNYSSKLLEALRQVRRNSTTETTVTRTRPPGRVVREAADRALAVAAKGRTRWSRAILTNRLKLKFKKNKPRVMTGNCRSKRQQQEKMNLIKMKGGGVKRQPALQKKVRVLGRLVPGCQKLSFPVILEEATDYIAALEMQVRTMTALTQLLSVAQPSAGELGSTRLTDSPSGLVS